MPIWAPQPGPQSLAVLSPAKELGYGGAAGGGKTDLMLGLALTEHKRSLIIRREGTQLQAIVDRSKEIILGHEEAAKQARYNETSHIWRGLPGRKMIQMGGIPNVGDEKKFQGQPHDLKAFDEATEIALFQFRFINGWNRSSDPNQRCRIVAVFNPPTTTDGKWVISYWAPWLDPKHPNPARPGELRYFTTIDGKEEEFTSGEPFLYNGKLLKPVSRTFIPAKLSDNAYYSGGDYESTLQALPEPLRSQMLNGDFSAGMKDDPWQVIPTIWVLEAQERWKKINALAEPPARPPLQQIGVDVARGGSDKTVVARRYGTYFAPLVKIPGAQTPDGPAVADEVMKVLADEVASASGPAPLVRPHISVDVIGVGASAYDSLKKQDLPNVHGVNVASGSDATDKSRLLNFANLRAEMLWKFREALDPKTGDNLALPDDPELLADLTSAKWQVKSGRIQIESKEEIKKRIGRSPDCSDALLLSWHWVDDSVKYGPSMLDMQPEEERSIFEDFFS